MNTIKLTDTAARVSRVAENNGVWTVELEWGGPNDRTIDDFDLYKICDISDPAVSWGTNGRTGWMVILTRPTVTVGDSIPLAPAE